MNENEAAIIIAGIIAVALCFITDVLCEFLRETGRNRKRHDQD